MTTQTSVRASFSINEFSRHKSDAALATARLTAVSIDAQSHRQPRPGDEAPDFELPDQDGEPVRLSELRGRLVVLYFYPKADTPGCTTQACGVRDHLPDYEQAGAVVLGASPDAVAAVKRFHDKQGLNFRLLADEDHSVADKYGVWVEKSMYGRTYWGAQRATFIIDAEGKVADVIPKVSPKTHDEQVLKILGDL
jgi:peroxiredoxin Q/BCP